MSMLESASGKKVMVSPNM